MSGFKNVMKDGWHPKSKDGKKESWRGDFKGINQVVSTQSVRLLARCMPRPLTDLTGRMDGQGQRLEL
jgi:hypothetical protein